MPHPYEEIFAYMRLFSHLIKAYLHRDGHDIYYEQSGNPEGIPVLILAWRTRGGAVHQPIGVFLIQNAIALLFDQRGVR